MAASELDHIPEAYLDLFSRPLIPHLATILDDGSPRVTPAWCDFDGECLRFTSDKNHIVFRTISNNPNVAVSIADPDKSMRYIEVRGILDRTEDDPEADLLYTLGEKMGETFPRPLPNAINRAIIYIRPTRVTCFPGR